MINQSKLSALASTAILVIGCGVDVKTNNQRSTTISESSTIGGVDSTDDNDGNGGSIPADGSAEVCSIGAKSGLLLLNRVEFANSAKDLLGSNLSVVEQLPPDGTAAGFDNVEGAVQFGIIRAERLFNAATVLAQDAVGRAAIGCSFAEAKCLKDFAKKAFRHDREPFDAQQIGQLQAMFKTGEAQTKGMGTELVIRAVLMSSRFLHKTEFDDHSTTATRALDGYELASRLSYFLWSSMPDEALQAAAPKLTDPTVLKTQVTRMLKSPKAKALSKNFGGQWLEYGHLDSVEPDKTIFPAFNDAIKSAMATESELFFHSFLASKEPALSLLDSPTTFLNEDLASYYGIPSVRGSNFRPVALTAAERKGLLGKGALLTLTSHPNGTSPVRRGLWVLERLLCSAPPPPPPDIPSIEGNGMIDKSRPKREQLAIHRANPACAGCHISMDPIGLGLENYDAVGLWRDKDGNFKIDPAGTLPGNKAFSGPEDLAQILKNGDQFSACLTWQTMTYALGRPIARAEAACRSKGPVARLKNDKITLSDLIADIIQDEAFLNRVVLK